MADIVSLLRQYYDAQYGIVNVRRVIDQLLSSSDRPFDAMSAAFKSAEPQWRLPILEGMRTLAATYDCSEDRARDLLTATDDVAADAGVDEHFKSINTLVMAPQATGALPAYAARLLERRDSLARRLAFYTVAMLLEHQRTERITDSLRRALESAAAAETSDQLKQEYGEILTRLRS